jgi:hypothetical protein
MQAQRGSTYTSDMEVKNMNMKNATEEANMGVPRKPHVILTTLIYSEGVVLQ